MEVKSQNDELGGLTPILRPDPYLTPFLLFLTPFPAYKYYLRGNPLSTVFENNCYRSFDRISHHEKYS